MEKKPTAFGTTGWCDSTNKRPRYDGEVTYIKSGVIATHYSRNAAIIATIPSLSATTRIVAILPVHHFVIISADYYIS